VKLRARHESDRNTLAVKTASMQNVREKNTKKTHCEKKNKAKQLVKRETTNGMGEKRG